MEHLCWKWTPNIWLMKFVSKFSLQPYLYRLFNKISCMYYNIFTARLGMKMTMTLQIFLLIIKYFCQDPPSPEEPQLCDWSCGRHRCCVLLRHPGVPHRWGPRVGRQRLQGSQGEEDHPQTSPAGHQRYVVINVLFLCSRRDHRIRKIFFIIL